MESEQQNSLKTSVCLDIRVAENCVIGAHVHHPSNRFLHYVVFCKRFFFALEEDIETRRIS